MGEKLKLNNWLSRYPVVDAKEEGLDDWFKSNPYVTGMAIGAGSNGITGPRRIVRNPYSKIIPWKWDPRWKGLDKIETVRHDMDEMNYKPNFQLSPEQRILQNTTLEKGGVKGTIYETDDNAFKLSIMSRIIAGDTTNLGITPEQINEYKMYFKNKYSNGGELTDEQYYNIMRKVAEENNPTWNDWRTKEGESKLSVEQDYKRLLNSSDYDYRGYYNKYPESAANADTHWSDEFKTAWHPTFSIESRYSGVKNSKYNPLGLPGGFWSGDIFIPRAWQFLENKDYYKPKYQLGGFLNFLKNSMQTATIAESPAVLIASGYKTHPNRTVSFNHQNNKGVKLLRNNLADIGEAAITAPTAVEGIEGLATIIRHPIRTGKTLVKGVRLGIKGVKRLVKRPQSNTTRQSINDVIDLARNGNAKAIQQLKQYGIEPGNPGVYRFISQEEADNILKGGRYAGRFNDGRVDVTANPNGTTAANSSFRITFKPEFDLYKPSQRVRMKNSELQDGWIMDGYGLDDVATIERRLPNGNYEPYKGQITITPQNTGSMTPELWTAAQDAAIARGDIAEAQRLRDLHFKVKSQTKILDEDGNVLPSFHYSENKFTEFNPDKIGVNDPGFYGKGFYSSPNKNYASTYGENEYKLYINSKEPFKTNNNEDRSLSAFSFNRTDESPLIDIDNLNLRKELENADAVWQKGVAPIRGDKPIEEIVVTKPTQMKLADAITYDNGVRIPLGERDNFNIKDIRYGLIPFVGLAGLTLKNK